jgi:hypothetical protein
MKRSREYLDCMIDIETLSTRPNAWICSIAAVRFNALDVDSDKKTLELLIDKAKTSPDAVATFHFCENTTKWWEGQPENVKNKVLYGEPRIALEEALKILSEFCSGSSRYWSQGINFDPVILEHAYRVSGLEPPWKFWSWRDARTVSKMGPSKVSMVKENAHDPLADCMFQVESVSKVLNYLKVKSI